MLSGLEERGRMAAETARRRAIDRLAARIAEAAPDRHPVISVDSIIITGRGVIDDPRLTWIGSLLR